MAIIAADNPLNTIKASFRTHLNYLKCVQKLLSDANFVVQKSGNPALNKKELNKFKKLFDVTAKSIAKDMEFAREDPNFAIIIAPWFPVKCYYALYYLESMLLHRIDGTTIGFSKGGHKGVRKKVHSCINSNIHFNQPNLDLVHGLGIIHNMPAIAPGSNATHNFWQSSNCVNALFKILLKYDLLDAQNGKKWDLRKPCDKKKRSDFFSKNKIALIDFFYWYRIKANYRDVDFIDFENGVSIQEVTEYLNTYNEVYESYSTMLKSQITAIS